MKIFQMSLMALFVVASWWGLPGAWVPYVWVMSVWSIVDQLRQHHAQATDQYRFFGDEEGILLSRMTRLTPDEAWQLRNFGVIRPDFMGWVIDQTVARLVGHQS